jgi:hypothetical protein
MLVGVRWFDSSSSHLDAFRRLQTVAGTAQWIPTFEPRVFPERAAIHRLLWALHRHRLCCFLTGTFTMFTAGILHSYASATIFVVLTNAPILDLIFQRRPHFPQEFIIQGFKFVLWSRNWFGYLFLQSYSGWHLIYWSPFFGIDTSAPCGPSSNSDFVHFTWEHSERLSFAKYAILFFPSNGLHPPLRFHKYYRAHSDGWIDIEGCQLYWGLPKFSTTPKQLYASRHLPL